MYIGTRCNALSSESFFFFLSIAPNLRVFSMQSKSNKPFCEKQNFLKNQHWEYALWVGNNTTALHWRPTPFFFMSCVHILGFVSNDFACISARNVLWRVGYLAEEIKCSNEVEMFDFYSPFFFYVVIRKVFKFFKASRERERVVEQEKGFISCLSVCQAAEHQIHWWWSIGKDLKWVVEFTSLKYFFEAAATVQWYINAYVCT